MLFVVPSGAELHRERNRDRRPHRLEDLADRGQILQQTGAAVALHDFLRRAPEIEVDQVEAEVLNHPRRLRHHLGIAAKKLGRDGMLVLVEMQIALGLRSLARRMPSAEVNSVMISPQPPRLRMNRRKTVSVTRPWAPGRSPEQCARSRSISEEGTGSWWPCGCVAAGDPPAPGHRNCPNTYARLYSTCP